MLAAIGREIVSGMALLQGLGPRGLALTERDLSG
jgi:hypothetical protein